MSGQADISCRWCGAAIDPARAVGQRRVSCADCGAQSTFPAPTAAELDAAYEGWYRPEDGRFAGPGDRLLRFTRSQLARRLDLIAPPGPILDIGSGDGTLVRALVDRGREAVGIEREDDPAGAPPDGSAGWAAVVLWHSLEHLPHPGSKIDEIPDQLLDNGVVVIAVPNLESLQARALGDRWLHLDLPRHLVHLPAPVLLSRLDRLGLEVGRMSHLRGGQIAFGWLHGMVAVLPGNPNLYDAIRQPEARSAPLSSPRRALVLAAALALSPLALIATAVEVIARRGGTIYVEARNG